MALAQIHTYSANELVPAYPDVPFQELPVRLLPSLTLAKGTLLGELAGTGTGVTGITLAGLSTTTPGLQTATMSGTNANLLVGSVLTIDAGASLETVTVLTKPTTTTFTAVFNKTHAASGVAVSSVAQTGTGMYGAYADANTDGTGVAKCILKYACATDTSGVITLGGATGGGPFGETQLTAPAYFGGAFKCSELTGLDAAALADLQGHLLHGGTTDGVMSF